jgi:hypothetical protein
MLLECELFRILRDWMGTYDQIGLCAGSNCEVSYGHCIHNLLSKTLTEYCRVEPESGMTKESFNPIKPL